MKNFPTQLIHSSGSPLLLDQQRLLLSFQNVVHQEEVERILRELDLVLEDNIQEDAIRGERVNHTDQRFWVRSRRPIHDDHYRKIEEGLTQLGLDWIGPVYRLLDEEGRKGFVAPLPNVIVVKLREQRQPDGDTPGISGAMVAAATNGSAPVLQEVAEKSKYLNGYRYFVITNPREINAYQVKQRLLESNNRLVADVQFETMPMIQDWCAVPNDTLFAQQWNMTQIQGPQAWDISTGTNTVIIAVIDSGTDLTHPDLQLAGPGIDLGDMVSDGSPNNFGSNTGHGTCCSGIAAGAFNNAAGVAGVAGTCLILPLAIRTFSDVEIANGINWAVAQGAASISMSFTIPTSALVDTALASAFAANVVLCAATGNNNSNGIGYPARHPNVMAIGASDQLDNRKTTTSPDGENWWGSNFGAEMSVVAPGVLIPSTDIQGTGGYNAAAGVAGDYFLTFNGTSSATPHVAGMAALIRSQYPGLTSAQIRNLIERSADKTGSVAYVETAGRPNGTWNQEMGYGRINLFRALDAADVMIKDAPADTGTEPFTGGNFWDFSDIVVRITDDDVFVPSNPAQSKNVERGQPNYIYVRVTNNGPRDARNVTVNTRITPFVGLQFVYPQDWTLVDAMHVSPAPITASFASIPAGGTAIAKFRIEADQTDTLYGWQFGSGWHPCLLASVNADNDYAFATAPLTGDPISARRNNLAQRNLSVIDVLASAVFRFPFIAGSFYNPERIMSIVIDRSRLPKAMPLLLSLDDDGSAFPLVDFETLRTTDTQPTGDRCDEGLVFLERTRVKTRLGCCTGVLTLEKGSRFDCLKAHKLGKVTVKGGEVILRDDKRYVEVKESIVTVQVEKAPNTLYPLSLQTTIPATAERGEQFVIQVAQQNAQGTTIGGAAMVYRVQ